MLICRSIKILLKLQKFCANVIKLFKQEKLLVYSACEITTNLFYARLLYGVLL
ncbi:hypothetical protein MYP_1700 [Sporocytophaga myxococcoides]|uniref:Uncharacterized protein n=1 Tax=Sporocytophaga myxococcoides TaxID=153721 RepID=A0A098LDG0_9BACT|nr:hypothetical protein MYP_1700 [Sporocytophaga myxococcoides]